MIGTVLALLLQGHPLTLQASTFGAPDVVLPSASIGIQFYTVKVIPGAAATVVKASGGQLVDGGTSFNVSAGSAVTFRAYAGQWYVVSAYSTASGGAGTPAGSVVTETAFAQASAVGVSTDYARGDHTHGTPTISDSDVPNTITIDLAATATALAADPANCVTATHFAVGINASGVPDCEAIADADVPNTITIDLATLATTATTANAGDSATAFFPSGVLGDAIVDGSLEADEVVLVGDVDGAASANDLDEAAVETEIESVVDLGQIQPPPGAASMVPVSDSTSAATWKAIPDCDLDNQTLAYDSATRVFSCGDDDTSAGGGYTTITEEGTPLTQRATLSFFGTSITCADDGIGLTTECVLTGGSGGNSVTTSVAVTSVGMFYSATVAAAWAASGSAINCKPYGGGASTPTAETIAVSGIEAITANISAGVGFDLMVRNPYGLEGTVEFRCVGV